MSVSVINSIRNLKTDSWWFVKIIVIALPVFLILHNNLYEKTNFLNFCIICSVFIGIYFGISSIMISRNIHNETPLLPNFLDIVSIIKRAIFCTVSAILPISILTVLIKELSGKIVAEPFIVCLIYIFIVSVFLPFLFLPMIYYSVNGKFSDMLNRNIIFRASGNFILACYTYVIQYIFTIGLLWYLLYLSATVLINDILATQILHSILIVVSILSVFSFFSDIYGDEIPELKNNLL